MNNNYLYQLSKSELKEHLQSVKKMYKTTELEENKESLKSLIEAIKKEIAYKS